MLFAVVTAWAPLLWTASAMRADRMAQLRRETVDMFYHGYGNYMRHAFPEDELRPLTCSPLTRDRGNPELIGLNDALGNYSLTLIDSLSTLAILAGGPDSDSETAERAMEDFQNGIAQFVLYYGDGRQGASGQGIRARGFDLDSKVQVFETVIRGLGGLLSAHLFAIGELPISRYTPQPEGEPTDDPLELPPIPWLNGFKYDGQLLRLALDLGQRLLPAFYTKTGIPYPRVNLRHGIPFYTNSPLHPAPESNQEDADSSNEITETCSAGAGSLTLEFTVLSRLTGDLRFEQAAKRAFWEVWNRRSRIGLIGNGIDAERGSWIGAHAGIGAGMDSFFEYALKSHILLSGQGTPNTSSSQKQSSTGWLDPSILHEPLAPELHSSEAFLDTWHQAHAAVKRYLYTDRGHYPYYSNNHRTTGQPFTMWIDSLGAFYPGLLALAGEVDEAIEANLLYTALWTRYSALPERWSIPDSNVVSGIGWWPGRPEFIESTYYIYRATQDPWYLYVGEMVLRDIKWRCHAPCGWAGLQDVRSGEKSDRMESFFLGETAKYLYLLFDPDHALNKIDAAYVFTTEGHPLLIPKQVRTRRRRSKGDDGHGVVPYPYHDEGLTVSCPVPSKDMSLTGSATASRPNLFAVSRFTGLGNAPNVHGPLELIEVDDDQGGKTTRYKALSNHTYFPWTLPPSMLPTDGTCVKPDEKVVSWIEFPVSDLLKSVTTRFGSSFTYYEDLNGPLVSSIDGLKMQLELQAPEPTGIGTSVWRITHLGNTQLGPDEIVHFYAEDVRNHKDGAFACQRRQDAVEIHVLFDEATLAVPDEDLPGSQDNASIPLPDEDVALPLDTNDQEERQSIPPESLLHHLYRAVTSVFDPEATIIPKTNPASVPVLSWSANTPTGPGAFPLPSIPDTPRPGIPSWSSSSPASRFPWTTVFAAGEACDSPLPDSAARDHHVILMRRGGCTFSRKLDNIPSFSPAKSALQIVLIVDELGDQDEQAAEEAGSGFATAAGPIRPLLETEQLTPKGMKRPFGIPMVLLQGVEGDYDLLTRAKAVGMRRKYLVYSQDIRIDNAVVL